jgi:hypothetical protein
MDVFCSFGACPGAEDWRLFPVLLWASREFESEKCESFFKIALLMVQSFPAFFRFMKEGSYQTIYIPKY